MVDAQTRQHLPLASWVEMEDILSLSLCVYPRGAFRRYFAAVAAHVNSRFFFWEWLQPGNVDAVDQEVLAFVIST